MANKNTIIQAINDCLKPIGFNKSGNTWHRRLLDVVQIINLDKDPHKGTFYINLAVVLNEFAMNQFPREEEGDIRGRITRLSGMDKTLSPVLDFENKSVSDAERVRILHDSLIGKAIPWLDHLSTKTGIREFIMSKESEYFLVRLRLKRALGVMVD